MKLPEVSHTVIRGKAEQEVPVAEARAFVDLVTTGEATPQAAAARLGIPLARLMRNKEVASWLEAIAPYSLPSGTLSQAVLAQMTKEMATAEEPGARIAAARVLIKHPDLGFVTQGPGVEIHISDDVRALKGAKLWPEEAEEKDNPQK